MSAFLDGVPGGFLLLGGAILLIGTFVGPSRDEEPEAHPSPIGDTVVAIMALTAGVRLIAHAFGWA